MVVYLELSTVLTLDLVSWEAAGVRAERTPTIPRAYSYHLEILPAAELRHPYSFPTLKAPVFGRRKL